METLVLKNLINSLLAQGYTHVYYPYEAGANFEKQILDKTYRCKSYDDCVVEIENTRSKPYEQVQDTSFIWDLNEELHNLEQAPKYSLSFQGSDFAHTHANYLTKDGAIKSAKIIRSIGTPWIDTLTKAEKQSLVIKVRDVEKDVDVFECFLMRKYCNQ